MMRRTRKKKSRPSHTLTDTRMVGMWVSERNHGSWVFSIPVCCLLPDPKAKRRKQSADKLALMEKTDSREMLTPCYYKKLGTWGLKLKNATKTQLMSVTHLQLQVWADLFLLKTNIVALKR